MDVEGVSALVPVFEDFCLVGSHILPGELFDEISEARLDVGEAEVLLSFIHPSQTLISVVKVSLFEHVIFNYCGLI